MMKPVHRYVSRPSTDEPRETESWALTEAARRLIDASRTPNNTDALQNALVLNQKLWTIFQGAISEPDCPLPRGLRENLAALSLLVDRQTMARMVDLDSSKLDTLIKINRAVASGLAMRPGQATPNLTVASTSPPPTGAPQAKPTPPTTPPRPIRISI